jgi:hypothetical protein
VCPAADPANAAKNAILIDLLKPLLEVGFTTILDVFYMAAKRAESGLWPSDLCGQADVLRRLPWESAAMAAWQSKIAS